MRRTELTKRTARNKGFAAFGSLTATLLLCFVLHPLFLLFGGPVTAVLAYRWFQYRAKWGLRF